MIGFVSKVRKSYHNPEHAPVLTYGNYEGYE